MIGKSSGMTLAAAAFLMLTAPAAYATTYYASTDGSTVSFNNNYGSNNTERFAVCDTASDGNPVYVDWKMGTSSGRDKWSGGNGTCGGFNHAWSEGRDLDFKSCEDRNNVPDDCSSWKDAGT